MANSIVLKCYLEQTASGFVETRRFTLEKDKLDETGVFLHLQQKVGSVFPWLQSKPFTLFWKDEDEDYVTVSTDEEMRDALSNGKDGTCKLYVKVAENEIHEIIDDDQSSSLQGSPLTQSGPMVNGDHQKEDPWQNVPSLPHQPQNRPIHTPPPPPSRFPQWGHHSDFGGTWGWRGMNRPFHGMPRHHGPHGGFHFGGPRWHHGPNHHFPGHWAMHHGHGGRHGWKNALRAMVPMPHRRWAKGFIQTWRSENIKNATSTSDDSDIYSDGKMTMANAGVPQAYANWLEIKLVCWHKKWCSDDVNGAKSVNKKAKKALKDSVPKEFRKWTKWYLVSHFGKREAPEFQRGCPVPGTNYGQKMDMFIKEHALNADIPNEHRIWTKQFIRIWRSGKKLDGENPVLSPKAGDDSDGFDLEADKDIGAEVVEACVPEEYKQWLEVFLLRWHAWRGQLEHSPDLPMRGGMGVFKDTVPMKFRAWVKYYLSKHYSKASNKTKSSHPENSMDGKYQKMLHAFQKKWLKEQKQLDEESDKLLGFTSSEEENHNDAGEPEASFTHLSLDEEHKERPQVRFDMANVKPAKYGHPSQQSKTVNKLMDFEQDEDNRANACKNQISSEFRVWAQDALREWDGETIQNETDMQQEPDHEVYISPNTYRWMAKIMMKMQMKKRKQQFKAAKREMKAAKKFSQFSGRHL